VGDQLHPKLCCLTLLLLLLLLLRVRLQRMTNACL
jgi:hypothetical protein